VTNLNRDQLCHQLGSGELGLVDVVQAAVKRWTASLVSASTAHVEGRQAQPSGRTLYIKWIYGGSSRCHIFNYS
jgi:hypothetical protein